MLIKFDKTRLMEIFTFHEEWLKEAYNPATMDNNEISRLINAVYGELEYPEPNLVIVDSPWELITVKTIPGRIIFPDKSAIIINSIREKVDTAFSMCFNFFEKSMVTSTLRIFQRHYKRYYASFFNSNPDGEYPIRAYIPGEEAVIGAYEYLCKVSSMKQLPLIGYISALRKVCMGIITFQNVCIVIKKPEYIHFDKNGNLHREGEAAARFENGLCFWALNGVMVPKMIAETPAQLLDPSILTVTQNVDVRREIVRKIGIEKIIEKLGGKIIDSSGDYELVLLELPDKRKRPYLKMKNPSIGIYHIEGVPPEITTVKEAITWRNGTEELPIHLT